MKKKGRARKAKGKARITGGPYVQFAAICETALQDKGGPASLIRLIDTITVHSTAAELTAGAVNFTLAIGFKSCGFKGRKRLTIIAHSPDGSAVEMKSLDQEFKGEQAGTMILANSYFGVKVPGLYWFDVQLDGVTATKVPLLIQYEQSPKRPLPAQQVTAPASGKKGK